VSLIQKRMFYGWAIVASMFAINFVTMATGTLNFGLFVLPMGAALGMTRSQFGWAQTTRSLSAGISSLHIGRLLDRHGPRLLVVAAAAIIGVCLLGVSRSTSPWQVILLFGVMGISGLAAPESMVTSVPVAKWFRRLRGRALALSAAGLGLGGVAFLPVTQILIDRVDWRGAWTVLAIAFMAVAIPLGAIALRRQPEDLGLAADGDRAGRGPGGASSRQPAAASPEAAWTLGEALRTATLWKLMLVFGLAGIAQGGASVHRIPYWIERGFDAQVVSFSFSADAAGAAVMALITGLLVDRFPIRFVAAVSYLGFVLAVGLMLDGRNELFLFSSTIIFGMSVGIGMIVNTYIFASYYGRAFLGAIRGVVLPITLVSAGIGAPLAGYVRDRMDSYDAAWWMALFLYLAAAAVMATVTPPGRHPPSRGETDP
jgi:MFS family permease